MLVNMSAGSLEDFYPAIAIAILMRYIRDPSLSQHHRTIVQAITFIFKSLGSKCIPYLSQVVPAYLHVIRASEVVFREVPPLFALSQKDMISTFNSVMSYLAVVWYLFSVHEGCSPAWSL